MRPEPAQSRPVYLLALQPVRGRDGIRGLRALLKTAWRRDGLRAIEIRDRSITIGDKTVTAPEKGFQSKPNTGALFRNERKINDSDRDYSGEININGTEYWLSGWAKQSQKTGRKYLSVTVNAKQESAKPPAAPFDDEIPL
jgi:hypothetical protein